MGFALYDYQLESKKQLREGFELYRSQILCIPTGGGKTVVFSDISKGAISYGNKVMIVCDRKELIQQSYDKVKSYGLNPVKIVPGQSQIKANCYVASVDTLFSRKRYPDVDLVIIDEAHKAKFDKLVDHYRENTEAIIIGATATPIRTGSQRSLHTLYDAIVDPVDVKELISRGKLTPAIYYAAKVDISELQTNRLEYSDDALFKFFDKQTLYDGVVDNYFKFCKNEPTIIFNVNREHSKKVVAELKKRGVKAEHVDGSFSDFERARVLNAFYNGQIDVISNCSILTTGYDNPRIKNVILNRATKSLSLFLQMCGRGSRIDEGKFEFRIIDMGSNILEHGFWDDSREWNLFKGDKKKKKGAAPVKDCPECEAMIHASKPICPHCGYWFPKKIKKLKKAEFEQIEKIEMPEHLKKEISEMSTLELKEYAKFKGYKPGWVSIQKELRKSRRVRKVNRSLNR